VSHGRTAKALKRTANSLPRVFRWGARQRAHGSILHGKTPLPCAEKKRTAKRALCHAPKSKTHGKEGSLQCAEAENTRQRGIFAVRRSPKRAAINGTFAVCPYKRTANALFLLLVLVTLPCLF
jgi:hypothetical protein